MTGEAVPLDLRLAKLPSRALAILIDLLILAVVLIALFLLLTQIVPSLDDAGAGALVLGSQVLVMIGVPTTVETLTRGKSVGKLALGLRVVRDDGGPIQLRHALVRALAGVFVDFLLTFGVGAVICSLLSERGKRIGDVMAGTVVVRERIPSLIAPLPSVPPHLEAWAHAADISRLPDGLSAAARNYLARVSSLSPSVRESMGTRLAAEVSGFVSPAAPPRTPAWAYLAAVLAERSRREMPTRTASVPVTESGHEAPAPPPPPASEGSPPSERSEPKPPPGFAPPL